MQNFLVIVHNDLDGAASAIVINNFIIKRYGKKSNIENVFKSYGDINNFIERVLDDDSKYERIFIADISCADYLVERFDDRYLMIDHHDTVAELKRFKNCIIDTSGKYAGCSLCLKHLFIDNKIPYTKKLKRLVDIAHDYDLWIHALPNKIAKNLNFIFYDYWGEKFVQRFVSGFKHFNKHEREVIDTNWSNIKNQIETLNINEYQILNKKLCHVYNNDNKYEKTGDINEVCEYLLNVKKYNIVMFQSINRKRFSVRAVEDPNIHVGNILKEMYQSGFIFDGGGHKHAGGMGYGEQSDITGIVKTFCEFTAEKIK
jgi:oligoribonuclease NrnB/cAMP/cGMP phosphodiesterase (DHH superfamily)